MANDFSAFNSEVWSPRIIQKLDQVNIMAKLSNRNYEGDLRYNKTVQVRTPGNISLSAYTPNVTTLSYQDIKPDKESFTVADYSSFAIAVDDVDKIQSDLNALDIYAARAAVAINDAVEAKILAASSSAGVALGAVPTGSGATFTVNLSGGAVSTVTVVSGGTGYPNSGLIVQFVGGNGNGATATATVASGVITAITVTAGGTNYTKVPSLYLTTSTAVALTTSTQGIAPAATDIYSIFVQARSILGRQNVPMTGRWAVIDNDSAGLLLQDTAHVIKSTDIGDSVVREGMVGGGVQSFQLNSMPGFIGRCAGFDVFETPHVPVSGANKTLTFGDNEAINYAAQLIEFEPLRLQTSFANALRGLLCHDTKVFAENKKRLVSVKAVA